jgi:predicted permease
MLSPRQLFRRMRDLSHGRRLESDVDDEIRFHIEMQTNALVAQGMSPGRARAKAESDFGMGARVSDDVRQARGLSASNVFDEILRDVRFALRSLLRAPAFTSVAVATLALGIGATTAMFSVVNGVLLSQLPYPDADRLVELHERAQSEGKSYTSSVSAPNFIDWQRQARTIDIMAAFRGGAQTILGLAEPVQANTYFVSHDYFRLFGGRPLLGRTFAEDESQPTGAHVAVVSEKFWREQLNARQDLGNVHLQILGATATVVGVMPRGFGYPDDAEIWAPLEQVNVGMGRDSHNDDAIGHLAPAVTIAQAEAELDGIAKRLKEAYPDHNAAIDAQVLGLRDAIVGPVRKYLRLLLGAVVVVLLVACVNLASANLARGAGRSRELAIRTVLGAGRARLARQLLTENVMIALFGGAIGLVLAHWLVRSIVALSANALPRANEIALSTPVMIFALGVTVTTGLLIGLLPAMQVSGGDLRNEVTTGGRGSAVGRSGMRRVLVATEVAFAVVLLIGAGLLVRSFRALLGENAGFTSEGVLAVRMSLPDSRYGAPNQKSLYYTTALATLRAIPGVDNVAYINIAPLTRSGFGGGMRLDGSPDAPVRYSDYRLVSPDYFATMRIPIVEGRGFTEADDSTSQHVTVINQAMAKKFFPGEDPIGKRLVELGMDNHKTTPLTVIGVAGDVRSADLAKAAGSQHYISYRQRPERAHYGVFLIRTKLDAASLGQTVRAQLRAIDSNVLTQIETAVDIRARSLGDRRFTMVVLSGFALLGLLLAAIGIYGVLAYSVARRTREIGVRMALGAVRGSVIWMVLGDSLTPVIIGASVGIIGAIVLTRLMTALLYGVTTTDPVTFVAVVVVLLAVATLASVIPAWRAARVDPVIALREE